MVQALCAGGLVRKIAIANGTLFAEPRSTKADKSQFAVANLGVRPDHCGGRGITQLAVHSTLLTETGLEKRRGLPDDEAVTGNRRIRVTSGVIKFLATVQSGISSLLHRGRAVEAVIYHSLRVGLAEAGKTN